jgi:hypothetical protein
MDQSAVTKRSDGLMAWAVTVAEQRIAYIGSLASGKKGAACGCVCPSCGSTLQAVNVDKDESHFSKKGTLRPHFRHDNAQRGDSCHSRVAQLAAFTLLLEHGIVELPCPRSRVVVVGASGAVYAGDAFGEPIRVINVERWADSHSARITVEGGRVVWLRLKGEHQSSNGSETVITIDVDDPEVATWSPERILACAELTTGWLSWECHWDQAQLDSDALAQAEELARTHADSVPAELVGQLADMTQKQRSESALHFAIKQILEESTHIVTPEFTETVSMDFGDGRLQGETYKLESMNLSLSDVRLERRLGEIVPDVVCVATDTTGRRGSFELLIEVAVTHPVDDAKCLKIENAGLSCLEIDVRLFRQGGKMPVSKLKELVLYTPSCKRWITNPVLLEEKALAIERLQSRRQAFLDHLKRGEVERNRLEKLLHLSDEEVVRMFNESVIAQWRSLPLRLTDLLPWSTDELQNNLRERGFHGLDDQVLTGRGGLLWSMAKIAAAAHAGVSPLKIVLQVFQSSGGVKKFTAVLFAAADLHREFIPEHEIIQFEGIRSVVRTAWHMNLDTYARPVIYDKIIAVLEPTLREYIESKKGTEPTMQERRRRKDQDERAATHEKLLADQREVAEAIAKRSNEAQVQFRAEKELQAKAFITSFCCDHEWSGLKSSWAKTVDQLLEWVYNKLPGREDSTEMIRTAWSARERGVDLDVWLYEVHGDQKVSIQTYMNDLREYMLIKPRLVALQQPVPPSNKGQLNPPPCDRS